MALINFLFPLTLYFTSNIVISQFNNNDPPERVIYSVDGRIRGLSSTGNSDVVLGGLVPVHDTVSGTGSCSDEIYLESVDYVEAFLYSLDSINNDSSLLPNTTLGYDIRDSCVTVDVAVQEAVDLALGNYEGCSTGSQHNQTTDRSPPVTAVVGAQVSFVSIPVASFLSIVELPQISYLSTSVLLNDKEKFPYFYRTVPSDDQQAQVMIDLAVHFGWYFVSAIHSNDLYGEPGMQRFRELAVEHNICIGVDRSIDSAESNFDEIIGELLNSSANVIVLFASLQPSIGLFDHMQTAGVSRKFVWITSDAVSLSLAVFPKYSDILLGSLGISLFTNDNSGFNQFFSGLNPSTNVRNPWFGQYYSLFYNCDRYNCLEFNNSITASTNYSRNQNSPLVIDAVYTFAHALDAFISDNCNFPISWNSTANACYGQKKKLNGSTLQPYLADVNFISPTGNHIVFDNTGSTDGRYVVTNYQLDIASNQFSSVTVAMWNKDSDQNEQLQLNTNVSLQFGIDNNGRILTSVKSCCDQCPLGNIKVSDDSSCCGMCAPCLGQSYIKPNSTASECSTCPQGMWGADPLNGSHSCVPITRIYDSSASSGVGIFLITVACILLIIVIGTSVFIVYRWNEDLMRKNLSREMLVVLITATLLCIVSVAFFVAEPSTGVCLFQRALGWVCFSFLVSPLLFIQIRNTWSFALQKGYVKRNFIGSLYIQVMVSIVPILFQVVLVVVSLLVQHPDVDKDFIEAEDAYDYPTLHLACSPSHLATDTLQVLYQTLLLVLFASLSIVTFKAVDKLNEAKYMALTSLVLTIFWSGFVLAYFVVSDDLKPIPISIAVQVNAMSVLLCFVLPRLTIGILFTMKVDGKSQERGKLEYSIRSIINSVKKDSKSTAAVTQL